MLSKHYAERNSRGRDSRKSEDDLNRMHSQYFFRGLAICRKMYLFLHGNMGITKYENIVKHFDKNGIYTIIFMKLIFQSTIDLINTKVANSDLGLTPRVHGNKNVESKRSNVLSPEDYENVVNFIKAYGDHFGYPLPGRMPQFKNFEVIKLPPDTTKQAVYNKYIASGNKVMDVSTFLKIWQKYCPYVVIRNSCPCNRRHNTRTAFG